LARQRPTSEDPAAPAPEELPLRAEPPPERADAARNRARILTAARRLFAERGVDGVSMDDVAREAGVGKGTVFRRFGDRAGLALALLDENERELQEAVLRGPPPLGPGAPATDRLRAFFAALLDLLEVHRELLLASETGAPAARFRTGVYGAWHQHTALLIAQARPDTDAQLLAHLLLAPLSAGLFDHLRRAQGVEHEALGEALDDVLTRVVALRPT
jgi:AcrR family transcriptional regulator